MFSKAVVPLMEAFPAGYHGVRSRRTRAESQEVSSIVRSVYVCEQTVGGVRQGCILSPLLFNLYLNELPFILNNNVKDSIILPDGSHLNCLLNADDLLLISTSAEGLQQSLDRLSKYCQDWINPTKIYG